MNKSITVGITDEKTSERLGIESVSTEKILELLCEKLELPTYKARKVWFTAMETIHEILVSGHSITLHRIGKIELRRSRIAKRKTGDVGGNIIAKMTFNPVFKRTLREVSESNLIEY